MKLAHLLKRVFYVFRDAITGRFVSTDYAREHKDTTVREKRMKD